MYRKSLPLVSQEEIGNALGHIVPQEDAYLFQNPRLGDMPLAGWGTQIYKEEFSPNQAFRNLGIPLNIGMHLIDEFSNINDITNFLIKHEQLDDDLLVCYNYGALFGTDSNSGHVNVFDSIDIDKITVTLIDPEQRVPKYRTVPLDKLFHALVAHGKDKSGGFWILEQT